MAVFYAPIPEAAVLERLQDGIWDAGMQVEEDFHCLASVIAQNAWLMFLTACGVSFLAVGLVTAAGFGLIGAILLAAIPYIYVSYLTLKVIQRYRQRQLLDHDNNDNFKEPQLNMVDIVMIMQYHPREPFISNNELDRASEEQLKRMLMIRQPPQDEENINDGTLDPNSLVEAVKKCRKYNEACTICFEDYEKGDCVRVISQCHHEFHDDCIIKWAGTFATSNIKRGCTPTCPLCNESLCRPCDVRLD
jgi:hypothetical protein